MTYNFKILFLGNEHTGQYTCDEFMELKYYIQENWPGAELLEYTTV